MPLLTPFGEAYVCQEPTSLRVNQDNWSYFKDTGRGFSITGPDTNSPLFVVKTKYMGKHRTFEDRHGEALCHLKRNFLSKSNAWVLTRGDQTVLNVSSGWGSWRLRIAIEGLSDGEPSGCDLEIKSPDSWGNCFTVNLAGSTIMKMQCLNNMNNGNTSSSWDLNVTEGTDLVFAAALAVVISDSYSEMHMHMA
ncbi:hypothetical protein BJX99DRAFT_258902 [Aspergillus californicus]